MYHLLISGAGKSLRKPMSALWGCKALYLAVQIFLLQYLFMIGHRGQRAILSLRKRQCIWAISQLADHLII